MGYIKGSLTLIFLGMLYSLQFIVPAQAPLATNADRHGVIDGWRYEVLFLYFFSHRSKIPEKNRTPKNE